MYKISKHPQVQYSLPQLTKGLFYHLQFQPMDKITVEQVCQKADLTRRTFYRNCQRKEDLVLFACDRLLEELLAQTDYNSTDVSSLYRNFFTFWYEHRAFLRALYKSGLFAMFTDRFVSVCNPRTRFPLQQTALQGHRQPETARGFSNAFILGGLATMLLTWSEEDFRSTPDDLVNSVLFLVPMELH